tara:strand:+ start:2788 stop:3408 length:621 start_codon:yes stop_codon:yes gene_type:complete
MYELISTSNDNQKKMNIMNQIQMFHSIEELKMWRSKNLLMVLQKCPFMFDFVKGIQNKYKVSTVELFDALKTNKVPPQLSGSGMKLLQNRSRAEEALEMIGYRGTQPYKVVIAALCLFSHPTRVQAGAMSDALAFSYNVQAIGEILSGESGLESIQKAGVMTAFSKLEDKKDLTITDKVHMGIEAVRITYYVFEAVESIIKLFSDD